MCYHYGLTSLLAGLVFGILLKSSIAVSPKTHYEDQLHAIVQRNTALTYCCQCDDTDSNPDLHCTASRVCDKHYSTTCDYCETVREFKGSQWRTLRRCGTHRSCSDGWTQFPPTDTCKTGSTSGVTPGTKCVSCCQNPKEGGYPFYCIDHPDQNVVNFSASPSTPKNTSTPLPTVTTATTVLTRSVASTTPTTVSTTETTTERSTPTTTERSTPTTTERSTPTTTIRSTPTTTERSTPTTTERPTPTTTKTVPLQGTICMEGQNGFYSPKICGPSEPFCLNIVTTTDSDTFVTKRCSDETTCIKRWWEVTRVDRNCNSTHRTLPFLLAPPSTCEYCCKSVGNKPCNENDKPHQLFEIQTPEPATVSTAPPTSPTTKPTTSTTAATTKSPVDGGWSSWSSWRPCSASCSTGITVRTRYCSNPFPVFGGRPCTGSGLEEKSCYTGSCPTESTTSQRPAKQTTATVTKRIFTSAPTTAVPSTSITPSRLTSTTSTAPSTKTKTAPSTTSTTPSTSTTPTAPSTTPTAPSTLSTAPSTLSNAPSTMSTAPSTMSTAQSTTTAAPSTMSTATSTSSTPTSTVTPLDTVSFTCYSCDGDDCAFPITEDCPYNKHFCMNTVVDTRAGVRHVTKGCVTEQECFTKWYQATSDLQRCQRMSFTGDLPTKQDVTCNFCCDADLCNQDDVPLYDRYDGSQHFG